MIRKNLDDIKHKYRQIQIVCCFRFLCTHTHPKMRMRVYVEETEIEKNHYEIDGCNSREVRVY